MRTIDFFHSSNGTCPVADFLDSLSAKQAQKVVWVMQLLENLAQVPKQYFKKLVNTADIWEIRIQLGSDIFRVLGFFVKDDKFVATNGFQKKSQKTPPKEIVLSEQRKLDYLSRGGK